MRHICSFGIDIPCCLLLHKTENVSSVQWIDCRGSLDMVQKRDIPVSACNRTPVIQPVACHFS